MVIASLRAEVRRQADEIDELRSQVNSNNNNNKVHQQGEDGNEKEVCHPDRLHMFLLPKFTDCCDLTKDGSFAGADLLADR